MLWPPGKHLTDIDIAKILALGKVSILCQEIAAHRKCGKSAIQYILTTFQFETFQGGAMQGQHGTFGFHEQGKSTRLKIYFLCDGYLIPSKTYSKR